MIPEEIASKFGSINRRQIVIGTLKRGDSFGEQSALNDMPNPFSVEAVTKEVQLYKILRGHFL